MAAQRYVCLAVCLLTAFNGYGQFSATKTNLTEFRGHLTGGATNSFTGMSVEVTDLSGIYTDPRHVMAYDDGEVRQQFSLCFRTRLVGGTTTTSSETSEVAFVPVDQLDTLNIHPSMRLRISHGLDANRTEPYVG